MKNYETEPFLLGLAYETEKAYLVVDYCAEEDIKKIWIPKSQTKGAVWTKKHDRGFPLYEFEINVQCAEEKGLL